MRRAGERRKPRHHPLRAITFDSPLAQDTIRVLLVDDDPRDRELVRVSLEEDADEAFAVQEVGDAETALKVLEDAPFDVILVDYHLPGMDGAAFLAAARDRGIDVPAVAVTGGGSEQVAVGVMRAGARDYLAKRDLTSERLRNVLARVAEAYRARRREQEAQEAIARLNEELTFQKSLLEQLLEAGIDGVLLVDDERRVLLHNEPFQRIWRLPDEVFSSGRQADLLDAIEGELDDPGAFRRELDHLYQHPRERRRDVIELKDGRIVDRYTAPVTTPEGRVIGRVAFFRDITPERRLMKQLAQANDRLEERSRLLQRKNQELEEFARVVSHDLREPLRTIRGFSQILAAEVGEEDLPPDARAALRYITDGVDRMEVLIHDLLAYARLSTSEEGTRQVSLDDVVDEALANLREAVAASGADIVRGDLPVVEAERTQMVQLFQNLVANALKFRHPDRELVVRVEAEPSNDGHHLKVTDNGLGIAPRHAERIFRVFQQLHGRGKYPGTGIGLAICKKIVERHGGRIWADGEEGVGTTFHIELPA